MQELVVGVGRWERQIQSHGFDEPIAGSTDLRSDRDVVGPIRSSKVSTLVDVDKPSPKGTSVAVRPSTAS
jgi:hypothetical protein